MGCHSVTKRRSRRIIVSTQCRLGWAFGSISRPPIRGRLNDGSDENCGAAGKLDPDQAEAVTRLIDAVLAAGGVVTVGDQHISIGWAKIGDGPLHQWLVFRYLTKHAA